MSAHIVFSCESRNRMLFSSPLAKTENDSSRNAYWFAARFGDDAGRFDRIGVGAWWAAADDGRNDQARMHDDE
jgi:hypothetical protein